MTGRDARSGRVLPDFLPRSRRASPSRATCVEIIGCDARHAKPFGQRVPMMRTAMSTPRYAGLRPTSRCAIAPPSPRDRTLFVMLGVIPAQRLPPAKAASEIDSGQSLMGFSCDKDTDENYPATRRARHPAGTGAASVRSATSFRSMSRRGRTRRRWPARLGRCRAGRGIQAAVPKRSRSFGRTSRA